MAVWAVEHAYQLSLSARRAWIEITQGVFNLFANPGSLSARRAWIEMPVSCVRGTSKSVALRKESVDRNNRATMQTQQATRVALRKESVDRNPRCVGKAPLAVSRSPQGERG